MDQTTTPVLALPQPVVRKLYADGTTTKPMVLPSNKDVNVGGRPSKIDEKTTTKLMAAFQRGHSVLKACQYAKISDATFYRHYNSDDDFRSRIDDAKNFWVMTAADNITDVLQSKNPKHYKTKIEISKWVMEKKEPEEFGKVETPVPGNNTQNNYLFITNDQLRNYIQSKGINSLDPTAIAEGVIDANVDGGAAERGAVEVHPQALRSGDPAPQSLPSS